MAVSHALDMAADILDERGWLQGEAGDVGGPRCMIGAMTEAHQHLGHRWGREGFWRLMNKAVREAMGDDKHFMIPEYNDWSGRTKDQVTTVLRKAAKIARREEEHLD